MSIVDIRPFRFGVTNSAVGDIASWTATARAAESDGYATFLLPDTTHGPAPLVALAAAAAATTTLHVGTWVLCEPLRNPRLLTWELQTLHAMCGDRFEAGFGAGRPGAEHDAAALGEPFGTAGERVSRLGATLELVRDQLPHLPILVAASGPRVSRMAGRLADTVALGWPPDTGLTAARAQVDAVTDAAAGRTDGGPELATGLVAVGDTQTPWLARLGTSARELASRGAVTVVRGSVRQMADELQRRRDELGISYLTVPTEAATAFAPVVNLLAGR
jgi:alkanesulfonate monooxygenase SsuD/methylene tetrahydromethanopterin reductase-like flavin-dependent oxidoreductase (luciferase family)